MAHWELNGKSDEWYTPVSVFEALGTKFDLDVAAPVDRTYVSVPAKEFITENALKETWSGFVWMNPPFGARNGVTPWLNRIHFHGNGVALTPDRSSTSWWQSAAQSADLILFVHGKIKFLRPDGSIGKSPSTGTTLFAYGKMAVDALRHAESRFFGITLKR